MMGKSYFFNMDYEIFLFDPTYNRQTPRAAKINEEFEYFFYFLEKETLHSRKYYSQDYLNYLKKITGNNPKSSKVSGEVIPYVGQEENCDLARKLNSKYTFYELLEQLHKDKEKKFEIVESFNQVKEFYLRHEKPILLKNVNGFSGMGHLKLESKQDIDIKREKIRELINNDKAIVELVLEKIADYGFLNTDDNQIFYKNFIGKNFQYQGSLFDKKLKYEDTKFANLISFYLSHTFAGQKIWNMDFMKLKDGSLYPHEVNYRKTMAYFSYKLWCKYFNQSEFFYFKIFNARYLSYNGSFSELIKKVAEISKNITILSPIGTNQFFTYSIAADTKKELLESNQLLLELLVPESVAQTMGHELSFM